MTSARHVPAQDITATAFASFGRLLDEPGATARRDFAAAVVNRRPAARANLALVRAPQALSRVEVREMERHPFSTQAFFPLDVAEYLVIVAPDDGAGAPLLEGVAAFRVRGTYGISYDIGVWHCGMTTLKGAGLFAVLVFQDGSRDDTQLCRVEPFLVSCSDRMAPAGRE